MAGDAGQDECIQHVVAASVAENAGIDADRAGNVPGAIAKYEECERELAAAIAVAIPAHAEDHPKLVQHRREILERVAHLKSLNGRPATIPVEDQIKAVQLGMQATSAATAAVGSAGGVKTLAACAALGAGAGFLVLGGTIGAGVSIVGGAAAAGYAATRSDKVGDAARAAGGLAIKGADKAKEINDKHHLTEKLADAGTKAVAAAKGADDKYGISTKLATGIGAAVKKAGEIENKHKVTDKVAGGISAGLGRLSQVLDRRPSSASSSTAPGRAGT